MYFYSKAFTSKGPVTLHFQYSMCDIQPLCSPYGQILIFFFQVHMTNVLILHKLLRALSMKEDPVVIICIKLYYTWPGIHEGPLSLLKGP